jgi:hypothetical protein
MSIYKLSYIFCIKQSLLSCFVNCKLQRLTKIFFLWSLWLFWFRLWLRKNLSFVWDFWFSLSFLGLWKRIVSNIIIFWGISRKTLSYRFFSFWFLKKLLFKFLKQHLFYLIFYNFLTLFGLTNFFWWATFYFFFRFLRWCIWKQTLFTFSSFLRVWKNNFLILRTWRSSFTFRSLCI